MSGFLSVTLTDATLRSGTNDGNEVPLVPGYRASAGIDAELPGGFRILADGLAVSSQVLDNDAANSQPKLEGYAIANLRIGWEHPLSRAAGSRAGRIGTFAEARNLFDARYATRGIYAFDFQAGANATFVTPAPGRSYLLGVSWRL